MRYKYLLFLVVMEVFIACKEENGAGVMPSGTAVIPVQTVLQRDTVVHHLPSPYDQLDYNEAAEPDSIPVRFNEPFGLEIAAKGKIYRTNRGIHEICFE